MPYDNDSVLEQIKENLSEELGREATSDEVEERLKQMGEIYA
jgi:hypothetical protein